VTDAVCGFIRPRKVAPAKHDAAEIIWREVGSDTPTDDAAIATMRMSQGVMRLMAKI